MKLFISALTKFILGAVLVGLMLFLPAGSLQYYDGWLFIGLLFCPMLILGAALLVKTPELLRKRLDSKEKQTEQKWVVGLLALFFAAGFTVAGLDYRFGWTDMPLWATVTASVVLLISYGLYAEVMRENSYVSRNVTVTEGQRVVDTGLYRIVRHPMYAVTVWLFLAIPIVLGSLPALLCFIPYPILMVVRIIGEERLLSKELQGYEEYKKKVRYRLLPLIW